MALMKNSHTMYGFGISLLLSINISVAAQGQGQTPTTSSCQTFVQGFYNWYFQLSKKETKVTTSDLALKYKSSAFSPELLRRLKEDSDAQNKAQGELVGLDFDPFLATNDDPFESYVVGNVSPKGKGYLVQIYGIHDGKKSKEPAVEPELIFNNGHWTFVNFHYEISKIKENENLLSVLKVLSEDRQKYPIKPDQK
jgi:hypothetical protein